MNTQPHLTVDEACLIHLAEGVTGDHGLHLLNGAGDDLGVGVPVQVGPAAVGGGVPGGEDELASGLEDAVAVLEEALNQTR